MLAQLKTVVVIKEAIKLAFFRLDEYLELQHLWVQLQTQYCPQHEKFLSIDFV
jgi:hypothetical protein